MATPETETQAEGLAPSDGAAAVKRAGVLMTADGFRSLRTRLHGLRAARNKEYSERLREARQYGEAGANDEYLAILEDEAVIDSQIVRLEELLDRARVVDERAARFGAVGIGCTVSVEDLPASRVHRYRVVGSLETGGQGVVTAGSPVGEALLGTEVDDVVTIKLPGCRVRTLRVVAIEPPSTNGGGRPR
jgi:transcription elongation factor GreA